MTLQELISNPDNFSGNESIHVKRIDGKFLSSSTVVLIKRSDEESDGPVREVAEKYCPRYDYFMEGFMLKDFIQDIMKLPEYKTLEQQVKRIIYYAEYDA